MRDFARTPEPRGYGAGNVLLWEKGVWRSLIKRNDDEAREDLDITEARPESVKPPPRRAKRAARAPLPQFVAPQLATLVSAPPAAGDWVYEVKHDGYRFLARISDGEVKLYTRAGNDWTAKLPHLQREIGKLGLRDTWLDGEIVVLGPEGHASFQRLQNAFDAHSDSGVVYFVFDAPFLDGKDQRRLALKERKAKLKKKLRSSSMVRLSEGLQRRSSRRTRRLPRRRKRRACNGCGRSWSPRSPTPSAPTRASCARPRSWDCARTLPRRAWGRIRLKNH